VAFSGIKKMGKRGPHPTPLKILKMRGSTRIYSRKNELQAPASVPIPPEWLSPEAKAEWDRVTSALGKLGVLTQLDRAVLTVYCEMWEEYRIASAYIVTPTGKRTQLVLKTAGGDAIQNPAVGIRHTAFQLLLRAAAELGMSPSARAGLRRPEGPGPGKPDGFFEKWPA